MYFPLPAEQLYVVHSRFILLQLDLNFTRCLTLVIIMPSFLDLSYKHLCTNNHAALFNHWNKSSQLEFILTHIIHRDNDIMYGMP